MSIKECLEILDTIIWENFTVSIFLKVEGGEGASTKVFRRAFYAEASTNKIFIKKERECVGVRRGRGKVLSRLCAEHGT